MSRPRRPLRPLRPKAGLGAAAAAVVLTALFPPTAAAGAVEDPAGDLLGSDVVQVDVRALRARDAGADLVVEIELDQAVVAPDDPTAAALHGFVDLDLDRSAATGDLPTTTFLTGAASGLGAELVLSLASWSAEDGAADLRDAAGVVARVPVELDGKVVRARIPRTVLATSGAVHLATVVGTREEWTDLAPNEGFLRSTGETSEGVLLQGDRFSVEVAWRDFAGGTGEGAVSVRSDDSAVFWFFDDANWELLLKVLDGCGLNGHFWVLSAATTNVEFTITVTDTATGAVRTWTNPLGVSAAAVTDTEAFATCP